MSIDTDLFFDPVTKEPFCRLIFYEYNGRLTNSVTMNLKDLKHLYSKLELIKSRMERDDFVERVREWQS